MFTTTNATVGNANITTITNTVTGKSVQLPTALYNAFSQCNSTPLAQFVKANATLGTNGQIRALVQALAQPGQYSGSVCLGCLATSTVGNRVLLTWAPQGGVAARAPLTRRNAQPAVAHAQQVADTQGADIVADTLAALVAAG
jgi:hypothetical protein